MGGPKKENINKEQQYGDANIALGNKLADQAQEKFKLQQEYEAPLVSWLKGMTSGDKSKRLATAAVPIGQIAQGTRQARENIYDSVPAGVGRDFALAGLHRDQASQTSSFMNTAYTNAFPALAALGTGDASLGLQLQGAGLRAGESGYGAIQSINNRDAQQKASTLGMVGSLAGAAGSAAVMKKW